MSKMKCSIHCYCCNLDDARQRIPGVGCCYHHRKGAPNNACKVPKRQSFNKILAAAVRGRNLIDQST